MSKTLSQYIREKYIENNNKTACDWRIGKNQGTKHIVIDQYIINMIGKQALFQQAEQLEHSQIIEVDWAPFHKDIKKIHVPMSHIEKLYELDHLSNPREVWKEQIRQIKKLMNDTDKKWLTDYYAEMLEKLEQGRIVKNADDTPFLECLYQIAKIKDYTWKRMFSEAVFHNSKTFEQKYESRVLTVLKKNLDIPEDVENYEILAEYGILTYSQTLAWKGNLVYSMEGSIRDSSQMIYGELINAQTLVHSEPVSIKGIKNIITIENQANYEDMEYHPENLYIFVHGFPTPKARKFLKCLTRLADENVTYYHWGDMDLGGIRIFQYLKSKLFPELKPMKMDRKTYEEAIHAGKGIVFDEKKRQKYIQMDAGELNDLKLCILEYGKDMEQEGVSPK